MRLFRAFPLLLLAAFAAAGCDPKPTTTPSTTGTNSAPTPTSPGKTLKIAMIPKIRIDYFNACERGGKEAAQEFKDVEFSFDGPTNDDSDEQSRLLRAFSIKKFDVITIACNNGDQIVPAIKEARSAGTHVLTFDSDANPSSGREFFVNQATVDDIAHSLVDEMVAQVGDSAEVIILSSSSTASNQNAWIKSMYAYNTSKYPKLKVLPVEYGGEKNSVSLDKAKAILNAHPDLKGIWAITSVAFPAAAQAVDEAGKRGKVAVVGLSSPKSMKEWVDKGVVKTVLLWNVPDLGFLTVEAARAVALGELKAGATSFHSRRLGDLKIVGSEILLGPVQKFTKENIAQFDF